MTPKLRVREGFLANRRRERGQTSIDEQADELGIGRSTLYRLNAGAQPASEVVATLCLHYGYSAGEVVEPYDATPSEMAGVAS
ncbi:XRE family transcriptional regulator [Gulosibacter macacae]|uniref:XRE family transcriptional regulator n=1 Tax=Gulosibacter macacae TaxID=2488791 RepID=A0A3P3VT10_9MICO|nr:helix-turn-helix transcriptional regulator [Gulosibacter macacae]RRJ85942.1 XRE family transcriptional regulator [Gulosibacter macacae]